MYVCIESLFSNMVLQYLFQPRYLQFLAATKKTKQQQDSIPSFLKVARVLHATETGNPLIGYRSKPTPHRIRDAGMAIESSYVCILLYI